MSFCVAFGLAGCAPSAATPSPSPDPTPTPPPVVRPSPTPTEVLDPNAPLRDLARPRYFGTTVSMPTLVASSPYMDTTATQFDSVTPANAMTWAAVEPRQGEFDWAYADSAVEWASSRDIAIRGPALVSDRGLPDWLTTGPFDAATLGSLLRDHVTTMVQRYAGQVGAWDVVADAFSANGSLRRTIWEEALGPGYVAEALQWAHAADPTAKLYIDDRDAEALNTKSDAIYAFVGDLLRRGVPIDGVGMEAHLEATAQLFPKGAESNIERFGNLGIDVAITALDVRIHNPPLENELDRQSSYFASMVNACFSQARCVGVTLDTWTDRFSSVPTDYPGEGLADPWDAGFNPKPMLTAIGQAILRSRWTTRATP
jgi:endo-1,4-beta-xylanase